MRKGLALLLILAMLVSLCAALTVHAETENLVPNGDFEEGDEEGWFKYGGGLTMEVDTEYAHSGEYGMLMGDREAQYAVYANDFKENVYEAGPGDYRASMWVRLADDEDHTAEGYLVINYKEKGGEKDNYKTSNHIKPSSEWQQVTFKGKIDFDLDAGLDHVYVYFQCYDGADENYPPSLCIDDVEVVKTSEVNGRKWEGATKKTDLPDVEMEHISVKPSEREKETTVGAIRWDAWYGDDSRDLGVLKQVEKTLSPAKYHFRVPFYGEITEEGNVVFPTYTQEIFDKEMEYAIEAGIDYFAYCWYDSDMKKARVYHTQSKYRNDVKFCCLMDGNGIGKDYAHKEMETLLQQDYYMTVLGGRPLMYYFGSTGNEKAIAEDIEYYRRLCTKLGLPMPYAVIMGHSPETVHAAYGDAVSAYGQSAASLAPYAEITKASLNRWESWRKTMVNMVPNVSFGWMPEPRYDNQVSWMTVGENGWCEYGTDQELEDGLKQSLAYLQQDYAKLFTPANTTIIYAWNEHDEGGWICPTLAVDENGNQLFNEDGTKKLNFGHMNAVKNAIAALKNGELTTDPVAGETAAPTEKPAETAAPTNEPGAEPITNAGMPWWIWCAVGGGVLVIAAIVVAVVAAKKKKKAE